MGLCAEIQNLSVSFHGRKAVSGINAALPSDGITVLSDAPVLEETFKGFEQAQRDFEDTKGRVHTFASWR